MHPSALLPFSRLIFALSLPLGALVVLSCPFLLYHWRKQTPRQRAVWAPAWGGSIFLWLVGAATTLVGAQHHRAPWAFAVLLLGNALVVLGGLAALYALFHLWKSRRSGTG